jgi:hypothetical protein
MGESHPDHMAAPMMGALKVDLWRFGIVSASDDQNVVTNQTLKTKTAHSLLF